MDMAFPPFVDMHFLLRTGQLVYLGNGLYELKPETKRSNTMTEKKRELWLAKNNKPNQKLEIHLGKPELDEDNCMSQKTFIAWACGLSYPLPEGHAAPLTIGEAVDCRPKPVKEIWAYRLGRSDCLYIGEKNALPRDSAELLGNDLPELSFGHRCRIAWDEHGIRLIGTPERI